MRQLIFVFNKHDMGLTNARTYSIYNNIVEAYNNSNNDSKIIVYTISEQDYNFICKNHKVEFIIDKDKIILYRNKNLFYSQYIIMDVVSLYREDILRLLEQ